MAHGLQDRIVKLDGPRNQERAVRRLRRHFAGGIRVSLSLVSRYVIAEAIALCFALLKVLQLGGRQWATKQVVC